MTSNSTSNPTRKCTWNKSAAFLHTVSSARRGKDPSSARSCWNILNNLAHNEGIQRGPASAACEEKPNRVPASRFR